MVSVVAFWTFSPPVIAVNSLENKRGFSESRFCFGAGGGALGDTVLTTGSLAIGAGGASATNAASTSALISASS